jgi:stage II sporulation protein GA (sporulation sigma-E factor processing peptidase)
MTIYIEYVILDNLVIDLLILNLTKTALKLQVKKINLFLSALLGVVVALISPLLSVWLNILCKIILALAMVYVAFLPKKIKQFLIDLLVFLIITFLFGGACFGAFYLLNIEITNQLNFYYSLEIPLGLILLIVVLCFYCCKNLFMHFYKKQRTEKFMYDAQLTANGNSIKIKAFLDSGNVLTDSVNLQPVVLINYTLFAKLYPEIPIENLFLKKIDKIPLKNPHYIDTFSISSKASKILVFTADNLQIFFNKTTNINNINVGLALNFNKNFDCDCIISPSLICGE